MEPYVTKEYYLSHRDRDIQEEELEDLLLEASANIDTLTFNRIRQAGGLDALTEFQQDVIRDVCCRQAEFLHDNRDMIDMVLSGYSINGVSMSFGSNWNVLTENGVAISRSVHEHLQQTGLCCRLL